MPGSSPFPSSSAVEQLTVNQRVTGSNPVSGASFPTLNQIAEHGYPDARRIGAGVNDAVAEASGN